MEILNLIDEETLSQLPLIFQTLKSTPIEKIQEARKKYENCFIEIDFYQTNSFVPYSHYKPISKMFCIDANKSK